MRYLVDHPQSYLEGVSLRQRDSTGAPQSENDFNWWNMELQEKIKVIANFYGLDLQIIKLSEEGAELASAVLKRFVDKEKNERVKDYRYDYDGCREAHTKIREELADVLLVAKQIEFLMERSPWFKELITELMNEKADRQLQRIKDKFK